MYSEGKRNSIRWTWLCGMVEGGGNIQYVHKESKKEKEKAGKVQIQNVYN